MADVRAFMIFTTEIGSEMAMNSGPSSTLLRARAVLALAAAGAVLAACGSSSKGTSTSAPAGTVSTAPSTASSSKSSGSGGSVNLGGGSFCDKARKAEADLGSAATKLTEGPDQLKAFEENAQAEFTKLADEAPPQIKGAISTVLDTENKLFDKLKAANFDFKQIDPSTLSTFNTPQFTQAVQQIDTYLVDKCGLSPSDFPTDGSS